MRFSTTDPKKYFFWVRSTKTHKSKNLMPFLKIEYEFFRVIGVKYGYKSPHFFEILIFSLLPFIVPPYLSQLRLSPNQKPSPKLGKGEKLQKLETKKNLHILPHFHLLKKL